MLFLHILWLCINAIQEVHFTLWPFPLLQWAWTSNRSSTSTTLEPGGLELIIHTTYRMILLDRDRSSTLHQHHRLHIRLQQLLQTKALHLVTDDFINAEIWLYVYRYTSMSSKTGWYLFVFSPSNVTLQSDSGNKRQCNHFCKNKELCAHECCEYNHLSFCAPVLHFVWLSKIIEVFSPPSR